MLKKTIVFITHDFDEAIRLADRIAIMNEGQIVQHGTAEELITNPATAYVAEFTREVPRDKLLSVKSVMEDLPDGELGGGSVRQADKLSAVAAMILNQDQPLRVVDDDGRTVGAVRRERVISELFGADG